MLSIEKTLLRIQRQIRNTTDAWGVIFSMDDIKILSSKVMLGTIKMKYADSMKSSLPEDLTLEGLQEMIKEDDDLLLVLKYCLMRNKFLEGSIGVIFPQIKGGADV